MWFHPRHDRSISLYSTGTSKIYDAHAKTAKIRAVDGDGRPIGSDVFIVTATVWNSGSESIEPQDVRQPLCLAFNTATRILEYGIVGTNDKGAGAFQIAEGSCGSNPKMPAVVVTWKHFDPRRGAKFQVIYAADTISDVICDSDISGVAPAWRSADKTSSLPPIWTGLVGTILMFAWVSVAGKSGYLLTHSGLSFIIAISIFLVTMLIGFFFFAVIDVPKI
jgi:hypothetical protein